MKWVVGNDEGSVRWQWVPRHLNQERRALREDGFYDGISMSIIKTKGGFLVRTADTQSSLRNFHSYVGPHGRGRIKMEANYALELERGRRHSRRRPLRI